MPAPRRKSSLFGFLSKNAKHRRMAGSHDDQEEILSKYEAGSNISSYLEDNICEDPDGHFDDHNNGNDTASYLTGEDLQEESPEDNEYSAHSLTAKPTIATLAETFSSGAGGHDTIHFVDSKDDGNGDFYTDPQNTGQQAIHFVDSRDESEVQNSEFFYSEAAPHEDGDYEDEIHDVDGYTEFMNGTQEEEDTNTLDYTATVHDPHYSEDHSESQAAARHVRVENYNSMQYMEGIEAEWEETSLGYETCSRTLNTNLEGMNYIPDGSVVQETPHSYMPASSHPYLNTHTQFSQYNDEDNVEEPQYYYQDDGYDLYQESFGAEGYYYDDEGHLVGQSYQEGEGHFFDGNDDQNTLANSTIATEGLEPPMLEPTMTEPVIATQFLPQDTADDASAPIESYESEESNSSWDDEETRDMSLLDEDDDEDGPEDEEVEDSNSESDSDDDSRGKRRARRRPKVKSMMAIINEMKHCSLKGSSVSYDDDDDDDDEDDDDDDDRDDVPDVAQISTGATSLTSMTDSCEGSRKGGSQQRRKKQKPRKKKKHHSSSNLDNLFNKVSALGQELLGGDDPNPKRKGKKSFRRRDQDPAARIVESLRDIFNCGHPNHY